jgi:hypothetical protein
LEQDAVSQGGRAKAGAGLGLLWLALCLPGCALWCPPKEPPPLPLGRQKVIEALSDGAGYPRAIVDGDARVRLRHRENGDWETDLTFGAVLAFERSGPALYLRGEKVGVALFTLKARGNGFTLRLPDTKEFVHGTRSALRKLPMLVALEQLALSLEGPQGLGLDSAHSTFRWDGDEYIFVVRDAVWSPVREVRVDRRKLVISRVSEYGVSGRPVLVLRLSEHGSPKEPPDWPGLVPYRTDIERPDAGVKAVVMLSRPRVKEGLPSALFAARAPAGWRSIDLDVEPVDSIRFFQKHGEDSR